MQKLAADEQIAVEALLRAMMKAYEETSLVWSPERQREADEGIEAGAGMFDDDITDLSVTVRETLKKRFGAKADDDRTD